jgi:hypothetical protein
MPRNHLDWTAPGGRSFWIVDQFADIGESFAIRSFLEGLKG